MKIVSGPGLPKSTKQDSIKQNWISTKVCLAIKWEKLLEGERI